MAGKDTFILTKDVTAALIARGIVERQPTSRADLKNVQDSFNDLQARGGRHLCGLSVMLALTVDKV